MAVAAMKKIGILGYRGKMEEIISGLQDMGMVHLTREKVPAEFFHNPDEKSDKESGQATKTNKPIGVDISQTSTTTESKMLSRIGHIIELLEDYADHQLDKMELEEDKVDSFASEYNLTSLVEKADELKSQIDTSDRQLRIAERKILEITPFARMKFPPSEHEHLDHIYSFTGNMPIGQFALLKEDIPQDMRLYAIDVVNEHFGNTYFTAFCHKDIREDFEDFLRNHEYIPLDIELRDKIPGEYIDFLEKEIRDLNNALKNAQKQLSEIAEMELPALYIMKEYYESLVQREQVLESAYRSSRVFYMTGWIRHELFDDLKDQLSDKFPETDVYELEPERDETPPVALSNPKWLQPFEMLTNMYGRPQRGMVDPTPWTGPFFALFFAFCMTDAGYGLILALIGAGALIIKRDSLDYGTTNFFKLIMYLGILTIGTGIIAGSYFGFNPSSVENPTGIIALMNKLKLFNALEDALMFFAMTVYFAMIQLSIGYALSAYVKAKSAKKVMLSIKEVLLGFGWIFLSLGLSIFITQNIYPQWSEPFEQFIPFLLIGGAGFVVVAFAIFGPLGGEKIVGSVFNAIGFDGLYGITGLFGDILSYARILALGISTGVIAGVINDLGGILAGGSIILGIIAAIFIAAGHVGYTALSALSAFIHPLRLQYVEYFGKFYETGGTDFKPFRKKYKSYKSE